MTNTVLTGSPLGRRAGALASPLIALGLAGSWLLGRRGTHEVGHGQRSPTASPLAAVPRATRAPAVPDGEQPLAIRNARVFDGARVLSRATVLVRDGKIAAVGSRVSIPRGSRVVDGRGMTLLPGLIDCHTHVFGKESLRQAIVFGVTTELDMFTAHQMAAGIKKDQAAGKLRDLADLRSAGTLVTAPGGHGTEYPVPVPTLNSAADAQAFVDARIAEGSDYIKIVYDDGKAHGLSWPTLSRETLAAVVAAARRRKKLALVHIGSLEQARDAIAAGADGLAHLFLDRSPDPGFARFAASRRTFVVPTLTVLESLGGVPTGGGSGSGLVTDRELALSDSDTTNLRASFPLRTAPAPEGRPRPVVARETVRQLRAAKVPILAGTDAPNPGTIHGASIHRELELLVEAGLTPREALAAATSVPAERFRLNDRGRIAPGRRADLLLVRGDPTSDIRASRAIAGVWKAGAAVDRREYRAAIEKQRQEARQGPPVPPGSEAGLVSDFNEGKIIARFGAGWEVSTDQLAGGKSTAALTLVAGGARDTQGALEISGEVAAGRQFAWAGALFSPGVAQFAPANLSAKKEIVFWAKGDGRTCSVMLFAQNRGFEPSAKTFVAATEWKEFRFPLSDFEGVDARGLLGVFIGAGPPAGKFTLRIDEVWIR